MLVLGAISALMFLAVGSAVGVRLLGMARRTGGIPELCIGLALLLCAVVGLPLSAIGRAPMLFGTLFGEVAFAMGLAFSMAGIACFYLFTWRVFRPEADWARGLVAVAICALTAEAVGLVSAGSGSGEVGEVLARTRPWALAIVVTVSAGFSWTAAESFAYYNQMRRRLALGLADPVVANRFLVWGVAAMAVVASTGVILVGLAAGRVVLRDPAVMLFQNLSSIVASTGWYLTFFPPQRYLEAVQRRAEATWGVAEG